MTSTSSRPMRRPATICGDDRRRRFVARVVAGDDDLVGAALRPARPSAARLVASRLPPQPNTHHSGPPRASASGRSAAQRLLERVGRVRIVDDHLRRRAARRRPRAACGRAPASAPRRPRPRRPAATPSARSPPITAEQVGDVEVADQLRLQTGTRCAAFDARRTPGRRRVARSRAGNAGARAWLLHRVRPEVERPPASSAASAAPARRRR